MNKILPSLATIYVTVVIIYASTFFINRGDIVEGHDGHFDSGQPRNGVTGTLSNPVTPDRTTRLGVVVPVVHRSVEQVSNPALPATFDHLRRPISYVESKHNPRAINKKENALGEFQIRILHWIDGNEYLKISLPHSAAYDSDAAWRNCVAYGLRYGAKTDEQFCRIHNGGPNGDRKTATIKYYNDVQYAIEKRL